MTDKMKATLAIRRIVRFWGNLSLDERINLKGNFEDNIIDGDENPLESTAGKCMIVGSLNLTCIDFPLWTEYRTPYVKQYMEESL